MLTKVYYSDFNKTKCPIGVQIIDSNGKQHEISFSSLSFDNDSNYEESTIRNHELAYFHSDDMDWHRHAYGNFKLQGVHVTKQEFNLIKSYWQIFKSKISVLEKIKWVGKYVSIDYSKMF